MMALDFLGWRIQRHRKKGTREQYVYSYPAKKSVKAVLAKVKTVCCEVGVNQPLDVLIRRLNPVLRGWCAYFRPGVSSVTFAYLRHYVWRTGMAMDTPQAPPDRVEGTTSPLLRGRMVAHRPGSGLVRPGEGQHHTLPIPGIGHPFSLARSRLTTSPSLVTGACGAPGALKGARRVREAARENGPANWLETASRADFTDP